MAVDFKRKDTYTGVTDFITTCYKDIRRWCRSRDYSKENWEDHAHNTIIMMIKYYSNQPEQPFYYWVHIMKGCHAKNFERGKYYQDQIDVETVDFGFEESLAILHGKFTPPQDGSRMNIEDFRELYPDLYELAEDVLVYHYDQSYAVEKYRGVKRSQATNFWYWNTKLLPHIRQLLSQQ